ncbi:MAG: chromosome partitioning protein ParB, partial [Clostridia bacterium]|nr:chromosome partitioning protein ParB [Clostridia bacterium]
KSSGEETASIIGEANGDSQTQVRRFIRLTNLIPELQEFVDEGMIKMRPAVELSYLDEESQRDVVDMIDETEAFPSHDQAIRMRKAYEAGELDYDGVCRIMQEVKPNQKPIIKIPLERIEKVIPKRFDSKQTEDYIVKALEHYKKYLDRQREQAR